MYILQSCTHPYTHPKTHPKTHTHVILFPTIHTTTHIKHPQTRLVRQRAATNLGALSVLSTRVDQLVNDLATSAITAEPAVRDGHLAALRGCLSASGQRLQGTTLTKVKESLVQLLPLAGMFVLCVVCWLM